MTNTSGMHQRSAARRAAAGLCRWLVCLALLTLVTGCRPALPRLALKEVATGLQSPTFVTVAPGDNNRLFVLEQAGIIRIVRGGQVQSQPFLDLRTRVGSAASEQGLLGLAFHPQYAQNGFFFVHYTNRGGDVQISRFQVTGDPQLADPNSEALLLNIPQPFPNHNGGMLAFGPKDGYLYIGVGDGGSANDPQDNAQRLDTLLGKILRIDVDGLAPYAIPPTNPFVLDPGARQEIWAYGLRNPWRFSFDRETGGLWIGDVGQRTREEINFQPAASAGGENYGWRVREGTVCRPGEQECILPGAVDPVHDYQKRGLRAVTGGYVYRGQAIPRLRGQYLFADYVRGNVWSLLPRGGSYTVLNRTRDLRPREIIANISSFGEDNAGEVYLVSYRSGKIYQIVRRLGSFMER